MTPGGVSKKNLWADADVETDEQLNDPSCPTEWSSDGYLSASSSPSARSGPLADMLDERSRRKLTNQNLQRSQVQQLQEKGFDKNKDRTTIGIDQESTRSLTSNGSGGSRQDAKREECSRRKLKNQPLPKEKVNSVSSSVDDDSSQASWISDSMTSVSGSLQQTTAQSSTEQSVDIESDREVLEGLPSIGSAAHESQTCKPCLFVHSKVGCHKAASCEFCHFRHRRKERARPCKSKRERYRNLIARKAGEGDSDSAPSGAISETESQE